MPADASALRSLTQQVAAYCAAAGQAEHTYDIAFAVEELLVNAATHGRCGLDGPGEVRIRLERAPAGLVLLFEDDGQPFDPTAHPDPDLMLGADQRQEGGLGIYILKTLMDVRYERRDGRNRVTLATRAQPPRPG
ncbi:ATP-binding protein [Zavarzinia sp. CC-PAN008]|uniref:ATP-binding protein n=1 Tax=Zavarzinia sp. CC-PAN008 TaxID=3243332 RepID=UPI003F74365B